MTALRVLGEELRRARERRGIALAAIADQTKITRSLLEGLERGDCSRWPGGIYNRAYVRDYAKAVGLPADDVVARFIACFAPALPAPTSPRTPVASPAAPSSSPLRLSMADDDADRRAALLARTRLVAIDAMLVAAAAALAAATGADFWISAAAASIALQAVTVLRNGGSAGSILAVWLRRAATPRTPAEEPHGDAVAAGSASVQLS